MPKQPNRDTAIVAVDDDVEALRTIETALRRRFGADYEIVAETSPERALERCRKLRDSGVQVAILLADQWLSGSTGIDFLERAHSLCPAAMRGLLLAWGDRSATDQIIKASALGRLDNYLTKPWGERDERFHRDVSELLEEWARLNGPRFEAIKIVGEQWSEWSHGLRDGLQRNAIPFGFYEHDSAAGRALLAAAGISGPLPVVIFPDGTAIAQPTAIDIADTLGVNAQPGGQLQDVVIIGAGPAGLAAAVYGASEGLRTLVLGRNTPRTRTGG